MRRFSISVALLILAGTALASQPGGFDNGGSTCGATHLVKPQEVPHCPKATQQGRLSFVDCEDAPEGACTVRIDLRARGSGLPLVGKAIASEVSQAGQAPTPVCAATGVGVELDCVAQADVPVLVPEGECREVRVRTTFRDLTEVEEGLRVVVQAAFAACRTGGVLRMS